MKLGAINLYSWFKENKLVLLLFDVDVFEIFLNGLVFQQLPYFNVSFPILLDEFAEATVPIYVVIAKEMRNKSPKLIFWVKAAFDL